MRMQLDAKSMIIGLLLGVCGMLAVGADRQEPADWDLEFATDRAAYLLNRHTGEYQRLDRAGDEGVLQRVGNVEKPR
jgi:hypothetical protein